MCFLEPFVNINLFILIGFLLVIPDGRAEETVQAAV